MKTITTTLAALALVALAAACTSELEAGIEGRTITVDLGTKPAYTEPNTDNPATRTNHTTGQWEVGDKVEVTFSFLNGSSSLGTQTQTLTCTAAATTSPDAPAKWSAAPAIIIAPGAAAKVDALYNYTSAPDPRTGTKEEIGSYAASIPLPTTGTLTMTAPTWIRNSSLMVVKNIPDRSTAKIGSAQWTNNTGAPASANFHMATGAPNPTFILKIDGVSTTMEYIIGKKYIIDARAIGTGGTGGTGGGDVQYINVDGSKSGNEIAAIFSSAASTNFCITGTGTTLATDNTVKDALNQINASGKKINLLMPEVTTVATYAFYNCTSLTTISLPAATSIGKYAFYDCKALTTINLPAAESIEETAFENCDALTTISLPAAKSIGQDAFRDCDALTTISLPAAESIGKYAFRDCDALTRLELTQSATAITVHSDAFASFSNAANLTLVLHSSAQNQGNAMSISVSDKAVTFANGSVTIIVGAVEYAN